MAVIKIVPMPGAVGDKGDEGAPGPQGQQGPAGQNGLPGTPALWSYQGAYNPAAAYAVGDVVVYQGQLYYTKSVTTAGTLPTNTTKFDLIAAKGADGTNGTNGTNGADGAPGAAGADFGIYYLGNYNPNSGYLPNIAVVRGSDGQLYLAKASGQLGDPVGNTAQWEVWIPKGADGSNGTNGTDGADALWNFTGPWVNGVDYGPGSLVEFEGSTYYHPNGQFSSYAPPNYGWLLVAAKGADVSQLNYWDGASVPQDPAEDGFLIVDGIVATNGSNILVSADDRVFIGGNNGEFLNGLSTPENQIATIGDLTTPTSGTWNSRFYEENGIVPNLSGSVAPGSLRSQTDYPIRSNYYTIGDMVFWNLNALVIDATQWGEMTSSTFPGGVDYYRQWRFYLPFNHDSNFYNWTIDGLQSGGTAVPFVGRAAIRNDFNPDIEDDEYFLMPIYGALVSDAQTGESYVALSYLKDSEVENSTMDSFNAVTAQNPTDLMLSPEPGSSLTRSIRVTMSGSYKKA